MVPLTPLRASCGVHTVIVAGFGGSHDRSRASGSGEAGFDEIYARAGFDLGSIPWPALAPQPADGGLAGPPRQHGLRQSRDRPGLPGSQGQTRPAESQDQHGPPGARARPGWRAGTHALIVACGLGDDAEEVSRRGYRVTAFDLVPAAIEHCRHAFRFGRQLRGRGPLPAARRLAPRLRPGGGDRTLQSPPVTQRADAAAAIAGMVRPGGLCSRTGWDWRTAIRRWPRPGPVSRRELGAFTAAGLRETEWVDDATGSTSGRRTFTAVYARP